LEEKKKMIEKIIALGKTIELDVERAEADINSKDMILSIVRDLDPETATELESVQFSTRIEDNAIVVYRDSAVMG